MIARVCAVVLMLAVLAALPGALFAQAGEPRPPIESAPDRGWISGLGVWTAAGVVVIVIFLLVTAYLFLRWTGTRTPPRKGPYDDVP